MDDAAIRRRDTFRTQFNGIFVYLKLAQSLRNQNWRTNGEKWLEISSTKHLDRENQKKKEKDKMCAVLAHRLHPRNSLSRRLDTFPFGWLTFLSSFFFFYLSTWLTRYLAHDSLPFRLPADISNNPSPPQKNKKKNKKKFSRFTVCC